MLELKNIAKTYQGKDAVHALENISFSVQNGDFLALVGASGSGKSTLLSIIGTMMTPNSGEVLFEEQNLYAQSKDKLANLRAQEIGFIFQQFHLVPYLTVLENILVAQANTDSQAKAEELLKKLGLWERKDHKPSQLSTGEQQRCALIRALINSPKLILADEPTGNLDEDNKKIVLEELKSFSQNGGIVIMATHDSTAAAYAKKTIKLNAGRIDDRQ